MPEPGCNKEKVWGSNLNYNQYIILYFSMFFMTLDVFIAFG